MKTSYYLRQALTPIRFATRTNQPPFTKYHITEEYIKNLTTKVTVEQILTHMHQHNITKLSKISLGHFHIAPALFILFSHEMKK